MTHNPRYVIFLLTDPRNVFQIAFLGDTKTSLLLAVFKSLFDNGAVLELDAAGRIGRPKECTSLVRTMRILPEVADCAQAITFYFVAVLAN